MSLEFPPPTFTPTGGDWIKDTNDTENSFPKYKTIIHNADHGNGVYVAWSNSVYDLNGTNEWPPSGAFDKQTSSVNSNKRGWASANDADGQYGTTYSTTDKTNPVKLYLTIPVPINTTSYSITARDDSSTAQTPKKWNFYGSYNGDDWTLIHSQDNQINWNTSETRTYTVSNHTYRHFMWEWLRNNGSTVISVGELKVFGELIEQIDNTNTGYDKLNTILMNGTNKQISLTDIYSMCTKLPLRSSSVSFDSLKGMSLYQRFGIVEPFMVNPLERGWTTNNNSFVTLHSSGKGIVITHTGAFFMSKNIPFMNGVYEIDFELSDYNGRNHYNLIVVHDRTVTTIGGTGGWHPNTNAHALVVDSVSNSNGTPDNNTVRVSSGDAVVSLENLNEGSNGNEQGVNTEGIRYKGVMELNRDRGIMRTYIEGKDVYVHDNQSKYHNFTDSAMGFGVDNVTSGGLTIYEMRARPILQDVWTFYDDFGSLPTLTGKHEYKDGMTHVYRPKWTVSDTNMVSLVSGGGITIDNSTTLTGFFMTTQIPMQDGVWETEFSLGSTFPVHLNLNVIHGGAVTAIGGSTSWNTNNEAYTHVNDCRAGGDNNMSVTNSSGGTISNATGNGAEVSSTGRYIARMVLDRTNGIFTTQIIGKSVINLNSRASTYNFATPYIGLGFDYSSSQKGTVTLHSIRGYSINPISSDIGTTADNPAPSAWFLKHVIGRTGQGVFYIRPPGSDDVIQTLCLFDLFGGGWTCFLAGSFDDTYGIYGTPTNTSGITNGNIFNSSTPYGIQDLSDVITNFTFSEDFDLTTETFATPDTWYKKIPKHNTNREYLFFVTGNSSGGFDSHSINNHAWLRPTITQDFFEIGDVGSMGIDTPSIKVRGNIPPTPKWWSRDMHLDTGQSGLTATLSSEDAFGYARSDPTNHFSSGQYLLKFVR
jgi:hypothetical protein